MMSSTTMARAMARWRSARSVRIAGEARNRRSFRLRQTSRRLRQLSRLRRGRRCITASAACSMSVFPSTAAAFATSKSSPSPARSSMPNFPPPSSRATPKPASGSSMSSSVLSPRRCPSKIPAASCGTMSSVALGGETWTYYETIGGGSGASPDADGASAVQCHMTNTLNTPAEALEMQYPLRVRRFERTAGQRRRRNNTPAATASSAKSKRSPPAKARSSPTAASPAPMVSPAASPPSRRQFDQRNAHPWQVQSQTLPRRYPAHSSPPAAADLEKGDDFGFLIIPNSKLPPLLRAVAIAVLRVNPSRSSANLCTLNSSGVQTP